MAGESSGRFRRDWRGIALAVAAFFGVSLVAAAIESLLPDWAGSLTLGVAEPVAIGAAYAVYAARVKQGVVAPPYPPLDRRAARRAGPPRPDGYALESWTASQVAADSGGRGGHLRMYGDQLRFDPWLAGASSTRAWVVTPEEIRDVRTPRRTRSLRNFSNRRLLTIELSDGEVQDFGVCDPVGRSGRLRELYLS